MYLFFGKTVVAFQTCTVKQSHTVRHRVQNKNTILFSDPLSAVLLVAKRSQIVADKINRRPPLIQPIVTGQSIVTVDFDKATSKIYWADATEKKIWSANQDGTEWKEVRKK